MASGSFSCTKCSLAFSISQGEEPICPNCGDLVQKEAKKQRSTETSEKKLSNTQKPSQRKLGNTQRLSRGDLGGSRTSTGRRLSNTRRLSQTQRINSVDRGGTTRRLNTTQRIAKPQGMGQTQRLEKNTRMSRTQRLRMEKKPFWQKLPVILVTVLVLVNVAFLYIFVFPGSEKVSPEQRKKSSSRTQKEKFTENKSFVPEKTEQLAEKKEEKREKEEEESIFISEDSPAEENFLADLEEKAKLKKYPPKEEKFLTGEKSKPQEVLEEVEISNETEDVFLSKEALSEKETLSSNEELQSKENEQTSSSPPKTKEIPKTPEEKAVVLWEKGSEFFEAKDWEESSATFSELLSRYPKTKIVAQNEEKIHTDKKTSDRYLGRFEVSDKEIFGKHKKLGKFRYKSIYQFKEKDLRQDLNAWSNVLLPWEEYEEKAKESLVKVKNGALDVEAQREIKIATTSIPYGGRNITVECTAWIEEPYTENIYIYLINLENQALGYTFGLNVKLYQGSDDLFHTIRLDTKEGQEWVKEKNNPILKTTQKARIKVNVQGQQVTLYINNRRVLKFKDKDYDSKFQNWLVGFGSEESHVCFDDVVITGYVNDFSIRRMKNDIRSYWRILGETERDKVEREKSTEFRKAEIDQLNLSVEALFAYQTGLLYYLRGRFDEAIRFFTKAIKEDDTFPHAFYNRAECYFSKNNLDKALLDISRVISLDKKYIEAYQLQAAIYMFQREYDSSVDSLNKAIAADPENMDSYLFLAKAYYLKRDLDNSLVTLEKAQKIDPKNREVEKFHKAMLVNKNGPEWENRYVVETKNYTVMSNISNKFTKQMAGLIQRAFTSYSQRFPVPKLRSIDKARVLIFESQLQFLEYTYITRDEFSHSTAGFYSPHLKELVLFDNYDRKETIDTLFHEGFHQFLDTFMSGVPVTFNEGMADYFGPSEIKGGRFLAGQVNPGRLPVVQYSIQSNTYVPLKELMLYTKAQYYEKADVCYPQGWSLMHFFAHGVRGKYLPNLKKYFDAMYRGKDNKKALEDSFSEVNWELMTKEWKKYILSLK